MDRNSEDTKFGTVILCIRKNNDKAAAEMRNKYLINNLFHDLMPTNSIRFHRANAALLMIPSLKEDVKNYSTLHFKNVFR
jgi:hypothetical protein